MNQPANSAAMRRAQRFVAVVFSVLGVVAVVAWIAQRSHDGGLLDQLADAGAERLAVISGRDLVEVFDQNEVAAEQLLRRNGFILNDEVAKVVSGIFNPAYVEVGAGPKKVTLLLAADHAERAVALRVGVRYNFTCGSASKVLGSVSARDCRMGPDPAKRPA